MKTFPVKSVKLLFCCCAYLLLNAPVVHAAWWPPTKWFSGTPQDCALSEVTTLADKAVTTLQAGKIEEFAANYLEPCDAFHAGQPETVPAAMTRKIFKNREQITADLKRVSPKTLQISEDLNTATIVSVSDGFYMNFVKNDGKWSISGTMQNLQPPTVVPPVKVAPTPAAIEESVQRQDEPAQTTPKVADVEPVVFKTASSVQVK